MKEKKQKESKPLSLTEYMLRVIDELIAEDRFGTAHVYQYALRAFMEFVGGGEIFFGGLSRRSLKLFENYLRIKLCSWNTVSTYTRSLRAVYNRAVDAEIIAGEFRLFSGVFTGVKSEQKRALEAKQIACWMRMRLLHRPHRMHDPQKTHRPRRLNSISLPVYFSRVTCFS